MSEKSLKEQLAGARRARRIASICMRGDLVARAQEIEDELQEEASAAGPKRLGDGPGVDVVLAQQLEDLREEMRASSVQFTLEAMSGPAWRELKAAHPIGTKPSPADEAFGADVRGFFNDAVRKSIVEPDVDDDDWERLTEVLSDAEWSKLVDTTYALNEEPVSIPFSSRAYGILRTLSDDSESQELSV